VLEIGCGHGLVSAYLALAAPGRDVLGVDIDADKIALARAAATHLAPGEARLHFEVVDPDGLPAGPFDAVVVVDVLYLLGERGRAALLDAAVERLAPGGVLVLKETDRLPRWKGALTVAQELVATRVLRITEGDEVAFEAPSVFAERLSRAGLAVHGRRVDRGYPHPHHLLVARRERTLS
jgi:SAM-dependent methyltransferase